MKHTLDGPVFYAFGRWLCRWLPRWYCRLFARGMADLTMISDSALLAVKVEHYRTLFPGRPAGECRALARDCFRNFAGMIVENFYATDISPETIEDYVVGRTGEDHFATSLRSGKGILVIGAHLGSWEMAGVYLSRQGFPVAVVAKEEATEGLRTYRETYRAKSGAATVTAGKDALSLLTAARALQAGGCVAMLVDEWLGGPSVEVEFAGARARFPSAWVALARSTGCLVAPTFLLPLGSGRYKVIMEPPFTVEGVAPDDRDAQVLRCVRRFAQALEPLVLAHPTWWFAFRRIFVPGAASGGAGTGALREASA
jgi:KDO2-lipid IV(A) lauroyltransferase